MNSAFYGDKELYEGPHGASGPAKPLPFYGPIPAVVGMWNRVVAAWWVLRGKACAVKWGK